jgi:hypothetical protein
MSVVSEEHYATDCSENLSFPTFLNSLFPEHISTFYPHRSETAHRISRREAIFAAEPTDTRSWSDFA